MKKFLLFTSLILSILTGCQKEAVEIRTPATTLNLGKELPSINDTPMPETCTDWYWVTYDNTGRITNMSFIETTCQATSGETPEPLNFPEGGGAAKFKAGENLLGADHVCPESVKFFTINQADDTYNGWQVAGVKGLHLQIFDLSLMRFVRVDMPILYFGLPAKTLFGTDPGEIVARAIKKGEEAIMDKYHMTGGPVSQIVTDLSGEFRKAANEAMKMANGGKVTTEPGYTGSITVVPNRAKYTGCLD